MGGGRWHGIGRALLSLQYMKSFSLISMLLLTLTACAIPKTQSKKKSKASVKVLDAYMVSGDESDDNNPRRLPNRFVIVWQGTHAPDAFFWRGDGGWLPCEMDRAHLIKKVTSDVNSQMYSASDMDGTAHAGDTLLLAPVTGGRYPIPAEIPATTKNALFYKTNGSKWTAVPIKKIRQNAR